MTTPAMPALKHWVAESRAKAGLPPKVTDPAALRSVAAVLGPHGLLPASAEATGHRCVEAQAIQLLTDGLGKAAAQLAAERSQRSR